MSTDSRSRFPVPDSPSMHNDHKADAKAAFMGLIFGALFLLGVVYTIVKLTNANYASHAPAPAAQH
jgi:hypothetical protein